MLPNKRNQTVSDFLFIGRVSVQLRRQKLFLVADADGDEDGIVQKAEKGKPGAENHGDGQKQPDGHGVHGVADDTVQARVHHCLPLLHLDGAGQVRILPHDLGVEGVGDQQDHRGDYRHRAGNVGPSEAEVESRQQESRQKEKPRQGDHASLGGLLFLGVEAFGEQVRGLYEQNRPQDEHGQEQKPDEEPSARVGQGSRREEQEQTHEQKPRQKLGQRTDQ